MVINHIIIIIVDLITENMLNQIINHVSQPHYWLANYPDRVENPQK